MTPLIASPTVSPNRRSTVVRLFWVLVLLGLCAWQGWMTWTLFGLADARQRLLDDEPIVSGRHPLHLYHGYLGASSFFERGTLSCYDPAFQAGYPKTPVFDSGSRPAELFLALGGGTYQPAAYKLGLAGCCLLVPLLFAAAARGVGLGGGAVCLAAVLGQLVWWSGPCRRLLDAGDLDLLLAALAALAQAGALVGFDRSPGFVSWSFLLLVGCLGWFAHPLFFAGLLPLILVYYLSVGRKHCLFWHLALFTALLAGLLANSFWLLDWLDYCWIRAPLHLGTPLLMHRTLQTVWEAPLWGDTLDRTLGLTVLLAAGVGGWVLNQGGQRPAARLLGLGALGLLSLALGGLLWEPLSRVGTPQLFVPALCFAALPAASGLAFCVRWLAGVARSPVPGALAVLAALIGVGLVGHMLWPGFAARYTRTRPLVIGLGPERESLLANVRLRTTSEARILWESGPDQGEASCWTALLPVLTGRAYLGGLDLEGCIEHGYVRFGDQSLAGRPLRDWTDAELREFCQRYNVGWVVCWSPAARARFQALPGATPEPGLSADSPTGLYRLMPAGSFTLKGQARLVCADCQRIALADVVPEDGRVVLSLHYQAGLRASPGRVQIEREPDPHDPIPFIRLRLPGPMTRVVLTWPSP